MLKIFVGSVMLTTIILRSAVATTSSGYLTSMQYARSGSCRTALGAEDFLAHGGGGVLAFVGCMGGGVRMGEAAAVEALYEWADGEGGAGRRGAGKGWLGRVVACEV